MTQVRPISQARHASLRWRRFTNYAFASSTAIAPLAAAEIAKAALALPLAFIEQSGEWTLAAVLGFTPGQNLYVTPNGQWAGAYIPAVFRVYPFRLTWGDAGEATLCVDEASGLVVDGADGEVFFNEAGALGAAVRQVWDFLQESAKSEVALADACGSLHGAGVIEPWPITLQTETGVQKVEGLFRVNEMTLNALDDAAFGQLRRSGNISVAYAQLLSMGNLSALGERAQARAQADAAERARAEVKPMLHLPNDSTIDWDWSKIGK